MNDKIKLFEMHLKEEEKAENTINKYLHDSAGTGEFHEPSCMGEFYEPKSCMGELDEPPGGKMKKYSEF